ncbi:MAG: VCBS repeat-containing protein [Candidatus Hydrogenedentes bacterium]|nr:VCBS repeat-containing protein [Candidatus Hydrogenedentota bacterium]
MKRMPHLPLLAMAFSMASVIANAAPAAAGSPGAPYSLPLTVTSDLSLPKVPMDPTIDFGKAIEEAHLPGVLDPNSIRVIDLASGQGVPCAISEDFAYGDAGRVEWVIDDPGHNRFAIRFRTSASRPARDSAAYTPLIGVGDLLRYNASAPRPIALPYLSGLVDLTGDGHLDLVGCWNYAYRPGWPWDGAICYPRTEEGDGFLFGDLVRVRYMDKPGAAEFKHISTIYMTADFADLNGDGLVDLVSSESGQDRIRFYLNSGERDPGGMPVFVASGSVPRPAAAWGPVRAADLNRDSAIDLVACSGNPVRTFYLQNGNREGWPIEPGDPVDLGVGEGACFFDVDSDGALDAVCFAKQDGVVVNERHLVWHRNLGGDPPSFGPPAPVPGAAPDWPGSVAAVDEEPRRGLIVTERVGQAVVFYRHVPGEARFEREAEAASLSAVMALSDQAWPWACDWDGDGDLDLLVGGGYGWPRILMNEGTAAGPAYAPPQRILSDGQPIRIVRNEVLGEPFHWHDMGYPYPVYADWDADGFPDLILPNETNRIFWYRNRGTRQCPEFGARRQLLVDGYPDSPALRKLSAERALDSEDPTYPLEAERPFWWRTGAGIADWNDDGLLDLITHDGHTRKLTLFTQYRDTAGTLRLKKNGPLHMADGRLIDDAVVERSAHWTESFRCVDWDDDGLLDIVYSCAGTAPSHGSIYLLRNVGAPESPAFDTPRTLRCFGDPIKVTNHGPHPWVGDLNGDGKPDVLTCVEWSVYPFFSHAAIEMAARPTYELGPVSVAGSPSGGPP